MIRNKIHLISPVCPSPSIALQGRIVAQNDIHFILWVEVVLLGVDMGGWVWMFGWMWMDGSGILLWVDVDGGRMDTEI